MRPRVLIVEDECDARDLFADFLELNGYEVTAVGTFAEARRAAFSIPFDAVVADLMLDTRDVEASWGHHASLVEIAWPAPVLLVTGWQLPDNELARRHVPAMVAKPVPGKHLVDWLATAVTSRALSADERRIVRAYFTALEKRDWDGFAALCTEDVIYRLPGDDVRFASSVGGRETLRAFTESTFRDLHDVRYELGDPTARPGYLTLPYRSTWTVGVDRFAGHGQVFLQLREGAIAGIAIRLDPRDIVALAPIVRAD